MRVQERAMDAPVDQRHISTDPAPPDEWSVGATDTDTTEPPAPPGLTLRASKSEEATVPVTVPRAAGIPTGVSRDPSATEIEVGSVDDADILLAEIDEAEEELLSALDPLPQAGPKDEVPPSEEGLMRDPFANTNIGSALPSYISNDQVRKARGYASEVPPKLAAGSVSSSHGMNKLIAIEQKLGLDLFSKLALTDDESTAIHELLVEGKWPDEKAHDRTLQQALILLDLEQKTFVRDGAWMKAAPAKLQRSFIEMIEKKLTSEVGKEAVKTILKNKPPLKRAG